jgi:hypothetical protein
MDFSDVQLHIKARSLHSRPGMTTRKKSALLSAFAKAAAWDAIPDLIFKQPQIFQQRHRERSEAIHFCRTK